MNELNMQFMSDRPDGLGKQFIDASDSMEIAHGIQGALVMNGPTPDAPVTMAYKTWYTLYKTLEYVMRRVYDQHESLGKLDAAQQQTFKDQFTIGELNGRVVQLQQQIAMLTNMHIFVSRAHEFLSTGHPKAAYGWLVEAMTIFGIKPQKGAAAALYETGNPRPDLHDLVDNKSHGVELEDALRRLEQIADQMRPRVPDEQLGDSPAPTYRMALGMNHEGDATLLGHDGWEALRAIVAYKINPLSLTVAVIEDAQSLLDNFSHLRDEQEVVSNG